MQSRTGHTWSGSRSALEGVAAAPECRLLWVLEVEDDNPRVLEATMVKVVRVCEYGGTEVGWYSRFWRLEFLRGFALWGVNMLILEGLRIASFCCKFF